jgi:hypothetical protein
MCRLAEAALMTARCDTKAGTVYVRVLPGGKPGKHLHVDCARPDYFRPGRAPKPAHKEEQVLALIEQGDGAILDSRVVGVFALPLGDLPETGLIRSLCGAGGESAGVTVRLTGARFTITGAPTETLRWWVNGETSELYVEVRARRRLKVAEGYLEEAFEWISAQFELFVLGRTTNEAK